MRTCSALLRRQLPTAKSIGWSSAVISVPRRHFRGMTLALAYLAALGMGLFAAPLAKAQSLSVLHTFQGGSSDGANPFAGLIMDSSGNLYGTTEVGGTSGFGTVFYLFNTARANTESVLHSFVNSGGDGLSPQ